MKIIVIGANGGIGREVVQLALLQGHEVTAVVRNTLKLKTRHQNLHVLNGDVLKLETIKDSFRGKDLVVSAIGSNSRKETTLYSLGNTQVLEAMKAAGVLRGFFISASGLEVNPSFNFLLQWATKNILQRIFSEMYKDLWRMESLIKKSDVNWTILRPPRLTNSAAREQYRFSVDRYLERGTQISRADLAHFILHHVDNKALYKTTVEVAY